MSDNKVMRTAAVAGGAAAAVLGVLMAKYPDRAIFSERMDESIPFIGGAPLFGSLFRQLANVDTAYDLMFSDFERLGVLTTATQAFGLPPTINTIDPRNVEHILKNNFANYVKGDQMMYAMGHLFGHGIFVANGDQWKYQRKTASHIFNVMNFRDHFTDVFVKELNLMCDRIFDKKAANGEQVDFHDIMFKFTLDSFVYLGFGVQLNALLNKGKVPFAASFDEAQINCFDRFLNPFLPIQEALQPILKPGSTTVKDHLRVVNEFAHGIISQRREELAKGGEFKDLLSRFMNTKNENGELLDDKTLRDMVLNFIIAGRDTTAQALSWTFYMLMLHPRVEAKLFKEVQENITDDIEKDSPAMYEVIRKMIYAHAVFFEVLRLYPSVPTNVKVALEDDILPDGTPVRKGDSVTWSPYGQGRSEKVWGPDAKSFRPERWITEEGELRRETQGKWPAFHAGPRVCLGQNLATLEALVAIVMLLRRYKFELVPNQTITYQVSLTHPMKYGMKVYTEKRRS
ncbi:cytochrome P450 [Syncephalastrum racemosum]|uniref:Cytochrome P450 n=1 Tax=Syncephalastrum racemosum TaxID=13706 RepID=A0A1X2H1X1_SYNRA|nr:cytochrome P450 [Syncephalastrum racemosum]